jgi:hypothetical protein
MITKTRTKLGEVTLLECGTPSRNTVSVWRFDTHDNKIFVITTTAKTFPHSYYLCSLPYLFSMTLHFLWME